MTRWLSFLVLALVLAACQSVVETGDASSSNSSIDDPRCVTPDGYRVCLGVPKCSFDPCSLCTYASLEHVAPCFNDTYPPSGVHALDGCVDGRVIWGQFWDPWTPVFCIPYEMTELFCKNGDENFVRYADYSTFVCGAPPPEPTTCPSVPGLNLCGPSCGACPPEKSICSGRSPLHPFSFCMPALSDLCSVSDPKCTAGQSCFLFTDAPADQPIADLYGRCIPSADCTAAAEGLPGGGKCISVP